VRAFARDESAAAGTEDTCRILVDGIDGLSDDQILGGVRSDEATAAVRSLGEVAATMAVPAQQLLAAREKLLERAGGAMNAEDARAMTTFLQ
jgi:hypothetical protein